MPATVLGTLEAKTNNYKSIFGMSSKTVYFITGTEDQAIYIRDWFKTSNANGNIANADMAAFDPNVDYTMYQSTLTKSVIVYNYSACEAFYNGEHEVSEAPVIKYSGVQFLSSAVVANSCANCTFSVNPVNLSPLFTCLGFSTNGSGSFVQGYKVDKTQIDAYASVLGDISFGVVATGDTREEKVEGVDVLSLENKISHDLTLANHDYFEIKISGITEELYDAYLFVCAYVTAGENTYYINNGVVEASATSVTYNQILAA
jgi:hypothetical protein